ncbi:MAG: putative chloride channel, partial [Bacteroidetes bacterium]|nr:putative chloride channel [Bacteroidota bacterium]
SQVFGLTPLGDLNIFGLPVTLPPRGEATLRLVTTGVRTWTFEVRVRIHNIQPPSLSGFPLPGYSSSSSPPMAVDLDGDGTKELLTAGRSGIYDTVSVHTLTPTGTTFGAWPVALPLNEFLVSPIAVGDIDNDGRPEIVLRTRTSEFQEAIRIFSHNGVEVSSGWPVRFDGSTLAYLGAPVWTGPVLADVTLDGKLDILVSIPKSSPGVPAVHIRAYQGDGSLIREYTTSESGHNYLSRPAVGDLDGDGENEVVAVAALGSVASRLYVWHLDGSLAWSSLLGSERFNGAPPVLVDADGDEHLEVVASKWYTNVKVFRSDGTVLAQVTNSASLWNIVPAQLHPASDPTERRIIFTSRESQAGRYGLYSRMFDPMTGIEPTGWIGSVRFGDADPSGEPVVANMSGDASLEIGYGNNRPHPYFEPSPQYTLAVGTSAGMLLSAGGIWPLVFPGPVKVTPLVTDFDGDGYLDLFVQADEPNPKVYGFALGTPVAPGCIAWGEEAHDVRRSGNYHGDLTLLDPSTLHLKTVGPPADVTAQSPLLVRTRFTRGSPVGSTDPANWSVRIGTVNAGVRDVRLIQGEHWLLVDPVAQPAVGRYKLRVQYNDGGILTWDAYRDAVEYSLTPRNHTQVTIVDRSYSMISDGKIEAARVAGRFLSEATYPADQVGVVSFANTALDMLGMGVVAAGTNRGRIATAVTGVLAGGATSIGAGIDEGIRLLSTGADTSNRWAFVLLSDGVENIPPFWRARGTGSTVQPRVAMLRMAHPDFQIHTAALGPDADQEMMQEIASTTGGVYYPVYLGHSLSLVNRLADVYHSARERIDGTQRLLTWGDEMSPLQSWEGSVSLPTGSRRLQFALNWDQQAASPRPGETDLFPSPLRLEIQMPDGVLLNPSDAAVEFTANQSDAIYTIPKPMPGRWTVRISNPTKVRIEALLCASAAIPLRLDVFIRPINLSRGTA